MANSPLGSAPPAADPAPPAADRAPPAAEPVTAAEFAAIMAPFGPWDAARRVAVAVSGGADSLCLALLSHAWGSATAIIVDHGLRLDSASEAAWTAAVLRSRGMPARVVTLTDLLPGPGIAARARDARYAALTSACEQAGLVDLLLGHHAADQAETRLMRARRGSGFIGLAGMAPISERRTARIVRPLLHIAPARLRATLRQVGQAWIDDPSNGDPRATRTGLRAELATLPVRPDPCAASTRSRAEAAAAVELAEHAAIYPEGWAMLSAVPISGLALGMLLQSIGGHRYPPAPHGLAALASSMHGCTLAGVRILRAGRLGTGWLLVREAAAMAPPVPLADGATWDRRFQAVSRPRDRATGDVFTIGALAQDSVQFRPASNWPAAALQTLPAIRRNNLLSAVPHLAYGPRAGEREFVRINRLGPPSRGAAFMAN